MFKLSLNLLRFKYNNLLCTRGYPLPQVRTPAKNDTLTHSSVRIMLHFVMYKGLPTSPSADPRKKWLTDSLICPYNALISWEIILKPKSYKVSGSRLPGQRSLEATTWIMFTCLQKEIGSFSPDWACFFISYWYFHFLVMSYWYPNITYA